MSFGLDLRQGIRSLRRSPGYTVTAVLSLALGLGAGIAAFSVLDAVRFRSLPFKDGERLVVLSEVPLGDRPAELVDARACPGLCDVSYDTYATLLDRYPFQTLDAVAAYTSGGKALNRGGEPLLVFGGVVSPNLFHLLGVEPLLGRGITAADNRLGVPLVTVLSYDLWTNQLAQDPAIIGQILKLSDSEYTVVGVMPPGFSHEVRSQFWLPVVPTLDPSTRPSIRSLTVLGRLAPGRTLAQLEAELATIDPARLRPAEASGARFRLDATPLRARYTISTRSHDLAFAAVVGLVLLIAVANLANLALARALHQQREFALRQALGAGAGRVARVLLAEQATLLAVATPLAFGFALWLLDVLASLTVLESLRPAGMDYRLDLRAAGFGMLLAAGLAAVLSLVPARLVQRRDVHDLLRDGGATVTTGRAGRRLQQAFVVAQIAAAVVLLSGGALMVRTAARLSSVDLGFDAAALVQGTPSLPHPWRVREKYVPLFREILTALSDVPGAGSAALRADVPLAPRGTSPSITLAGSATPLPSSLVPAVSHAVSPGYFEGLGITMLLGRGFDSRDIDRGLPVAIVNQWAADRWWAGEDPIGRQLRVDSAPGRGTMVTIVGVVRDNKAAQASLILAQDGPELYRPFEQLSSAFPTFYVRATHAPAPLLRPVQDVLVRLVPDRPLFAQAVADRVAEQLGGVRVNALQILGFAIVGLGLALIGVYGVLAYAVGRRTQELGIRGALGASRGRLGAGVLREGLRMSVLGLLVGVPVAVLASGLIEELLHGTSRTDPLVYGGVAVVTLLAAVAGSYLPARRAARIDPLVALRSG